VKVALGLPLSWVVLRGNRECPSWLAPGSKMVYPKVKFWNCKIQMKALGEHFPDQLKFWRYDVIWWRNDVKSFVKQNTKCTCSHLSQYILEWGTRVNACSNGGTWVNACLNGGGLLQDTVSPMGDMVHFFGANSVATRDLHFQGHFICRPAIFMSRCRDVRWG
jgi:hypothetical protein